MTRFIALLFSGIAFGGIITLVALGFVLLHRATGVINFAHGELISLGGYLAVWLIADLGFPVALGYFGAVALMALVGVVMERVAFAPLRDQSVLVVVISTLGAAVVIRSLISIWQGSTPRKLPSVVSDGGLEVLGAVIAYQRLLILGVTAAVVTAMLLAFHHTSFGRKLRAVAADREVAQLQGINVRAMSMIAFALSAALAGLAGVLIAPLTALDLSLGFSIMLTAFVAAILGGFGSLGGVVVAALIIGVVQQTLGGYVFRDFAEVLPFVLMLVVIAIRPTGFNTIQTSRL